MLRWPPATVWAATPREIALAARAMFGEPQPPLDRTRLDALMARYPDGSLP